MQESVVFSLGNHENESIGIVYEVDTPLWDEVSISTTTPGKSTDIAIWTRKLPCLERLAPRPPSDHCIFLLGALPQSPAWRPIFFILLFVNWEQHHPPETKFLNQGIMRTEKPDLTFPTFCWFPRQGGKPVPPIINTMPTYRKQTLWTLAVQGCCEFSLSGEMQRIILLFLCKYEATTAVAIYDYNPNAI